MTPTTPQLMWPHDAAAMYDRLVVRGITSDDTGEAFTLVDIDWAIQQAMETAAAREGWNGLPEITDAIRWVISDDVAAHLGLDYDEVWEVAP